MSDESSVHDPKTDGLTGIFDESDHGVSEQEKREIRAQLDSLVRKPQGAEDDRRLGYEPRHRRDTIPSLIGVGATVVGAIAAVMLFVSFEQQEQTLLADARAAETAEAQLLEEFRQQAEERLAAREGEIAEMRDELGALEQERDTAIQEAEAAFREREAELETELEEALAAERERLEAEGFTGDELESRLRDIESELDERYSAELDELQQQHEAEIATREGRLEALEAELERGVAELDRFEAEYEQTAEELTLLIDQREEALEYTRLLSDQYQRAIDLIEQGSYAEAEDAIATIDSMLAAEEIDHLPIIDERADADRSLLTALRRLTELEAIDPEARLAAASDRQESLEQQIAQLESQLSNLESARDQARRSADAYREEAEASESRLDTLLAELRESQSELANLHAESANSEEDFETIIASVDVRLEVLDALRSDEVQEEHPRLDDAFEEYLDRFARAKERAGYSAALQRARELLDSVSAE